jgi:hypothetical protein
VQSSRPSVAASLTAMPWIASQTATELNRQIVPGRIQARALSPIGKTRISSESTARFAHKGPIEHDLRHGKHALGFSLILLNLIHSYPPSAVGIARSNRYNPVRCKQLCAAATDRGRLPDAARRGARHGR